MMEEIKKVIDEQFDELPRTVCTYMGASLLEFDKDYLIKLICIQEQNIERIQNEMNGRLPI